MIDERYCCQVGTEKQHRFACVLASKLGYTALRYAVSDALGISVSKVGRSICTIKDAGKVIDYLKNKDGEIE
jgi:hypothetical protein